MAGKTGLGKGLEALFSNTVSEVPDVEKIQNGEFQYEENRLLEINFENAKCTYDTNMNKYVTKKKSSGKVDMVVALINAIYLLEQDVIFNQNDFVVQVL